MEMSAETTEGSNFGTSSSSIMDRNMDQDSISEDAEHVPVQIIKVEKTDDIILPMVEKVHNTNDDDYNEAIDERLKPVTTELPSVSVGDKCTPHAQHQISSSRCGDISDNTEVVAVNASDSEHRQSPEVTQDDQNFNVQTKFAHIIDDHAENFQHKLHQQWLGGQFCDLSLQLKDREVKVHSCVLAAFSPGLHYMNKGEPLILADVEHSAIAPLINMMYTGILCFDSQYAHQVAHAAHELLMPEICSVIEDYKKQCQSQASKGHQSKLPMSQARHASWSPQAFSRQSTPVARNPSKRPRKRACPTKIKIEDAPMPIKTPTPIKTLPKKKRNTPKKIKESPTPAEPKESDFPKTEVVKDEELDESIDDFDDADDDIGDDGFEDLDDDYKTEVDSDFTPSPHKGKAKRADTSESKTPSCSWCKMKFSTHEEVQAHLNTCATYKNAWKCEECGTSYLRKSNLTRHIIKVHSKFVHLQCRFCDFTTKLEKQLRNHCLDMHNGQKPFVCDHPECTYDTFIFDRLRHHKKTHDEVKDYCCVKCGKTTTTKKALESHHRTCYQLKEFLCDVCGQAFNHPQSMMIHRGAIHFGEKPFQCSECGNRFSDHRNLKRHQRIHLNEYPYACQVCEQKFRHSNSLKAHMKRHTDIMLATIDHVDTGPPSTSSGLIGLK